MNHGQVKQFESLLAEGDFSRALILLDKIKTDLDRSNVRRRTELKNREQLLIIQAEQRAMQDKIMADVQKDHDTLKETWEYCKGQLATDKNKTKAQNLVNEAEYALKALNKPKLEAMDKQLEQILLLDPSKAEWAAKFKLTVEKILGIVSVAHQTDPAVKARIEAKKEVIDPNKTQPRKKKVLKTIEMEVDE